MSLIIKFYFTYSMLNMFRTLIHPSSWACDFSIVSPRWSCVLVSMYVGVSVWLGWVGVVSVYQTSAHTHTLSLSLYIYIYILLFLILLFWCMYYVVRQWSLRTRHCVLAVAALNRTLSMVWWRWHIISNLVFINLIKQNSECSCSI